MLKLMDKKIAASLRLKICLSGPMQGKQFLPVSLLTSGLTDGRRTTPLSIAHTDQLWKSYQAIILVTGEIRPALKVSAIAKTVVTIDWIGWNWTN